jgi:hypothetical protein
LRRKATQIGFAEVGFNKETSKISDEEKRLYLAKTEA